MPRLLAAGETLALLVPGAISVPLGRSSAEMLWRSMRDGGLAIVGRARALGICSRLMSDSGVSAQIQSCGVAVLRLLRTRPQGCTKRELTAELDVSPPTVQRALTWLREVYDAPIEFEAAAHRWRLHDPAFTLPLADPQASDLEAICLAQALLEPYASDEMMASLRRMVEQMDQSVRLQGDAATRPIAPRNLRVTLTSAARCLPEVKRTLLACVGRHPAQIAYCSPWAEVPITKTYEVDPWQVRIHDGASYLRAYVRQHSQPRWFNMSHILAVDVDEQVGLLPEAIASLRADNPDDPLYGIDHDRPGYATIILEGAVARWVSGFIWHPQQIDRWIAPGQTLERRLAFGSVREFARRLSALADGLVAVEPESLRCEVVRQAQTMVGKLAR